jgi:hypothetical protein
MPQKLVLGCDNSTANRHKPSVPLLPWLATRAVDRSSFLGLTSITAEFMGGFVWDLNKAPCALMASVSAGSDTCAPPSGFQMTVIRVAISTRSLRRRSDPAGGASAFSGFNITAPPWITPLL